MRPLLLALVCTLALGPIGCATAPATKQDRTNLISASGQTLATFKQNKPGYYKVYNDSAVGKAVFPSIGKGGIFLGGAYGQGVVYEGNTVVGYCKIEQATVGFQLGGQAYSQIIFFQNKSSLQAFKRGQLAGAAQASAVAIKADASAQADYKDGVAVFSMDSAGLMYEASIGGQKFSYLPKDALD
ncbi:MAG: lipid-binding SYLF domain-containing protein [Planctomycetota bacterium]